MAEISIIVPVYRAEAYLPACIDSILNQTVSNFELILVNDGSPDSCGQICEDYALRDSRIKVLHQENQGQAAARNHALTIAEGKWVCFVDSDDLIHPQMVELLLQGLQETGAAISMCQMLEAQTMPEDFMAPATAEFSLYTMDEDTLVSMLDREEYPAWVGCAKLIPKEIIEDHPFCPGRVYEDNEAVCHWVCKGGTLAVTDRKLYFYRTNPISTTQRSFSIKRLDYLWALEQIIRFYHSLGYHTLTQRFCGRYAEMAASFYRGAVQELKDETVAKGIEKDAIRLFLRDRIPLTQDQFEMMFDAMHPKLVKYYWPMEAGIRTLREKGISSLAEKVKAQLRKGDRP